MNRFVTFLFLFSIFFCASDCVDFCDVETMDNVWNVGQFIYITRCGEVWTFDPRMRGGIGGFFRDHSWFIFARNRFAMNIANEPGNKGTFKKELLHFATFSFIDIVCEDWWLEIERDCPYSASLWNGFSVMIDNVEIIAYRTRNEPHYDGYSFPNPLDLDHTSDVQTTESPFWPKMHKLVPEYRWRSKGRIHSALFYKEEYRLFMAILMPEDNYYCITHLNMRSMMFDAREWPKYYWIKSGKTYQKLGRDIDWAPAYCFTGNVVGMFSKEGQPYVVGRVLNSSRQFEDTVYAMKASDGKKRQPDNDYPHSLRTFFGCDFTKPYIPTTTTTPTTTTRYRPVAIYVMTDSIP